MAGQRHQILAEKEKKGKKFVRSTIWRCQTVGWPSVAKKGQKKVEN
jgi:hypothetical protein